LQRQGRQVQVQQQGQRQVQRQVQRQAQRQVQWQVQEWEQLQGKLQVGQTCRVRRAPQWPPF
jgi:hypothetical protein